MAARLFRRRRVAALLLLTLLLAAVAGHLYWLDLRERLGLQQLDWQAPALSRQGLQLGALHLEHHSADGAVLQLHAERLQLDWPDLAAGLAAPRLAIARLQLDWRPGTPGSTTDAMPGALPAQLLAVLPRQLQIEHLDARLPCPGTPCQLVGQLQLQHAGRSLLPASARLQANDGSRVLQLTAALSGNLAAADLQAALSLDGTDILQFAAGLRHNSDTSQLQVHLHLPPRPAGTTLPDWLAALPGRAGPHIRAAWSPRASLDARAELALPAGWQPGDDLPGQIAVHQAQLSARLPHLQLNDLTLHELHAELPLHGAWQRDSGLHLVAGDGARIGAARLAAAGLHGAALQLTLAGLRLEPEQRLHGPLRLRIARLQHSTLQPQDWQAALQLDARPTAQRLDGRLDSSSGLAARLQARHASSDGLRLELHLQDIDLATGNPLAHSLSAWPALLETSAGRLQGHLRLHVAPGGAPALGAELHLNDIDGLFDRLAFAGLTARLHAELRDTRLHLQVPQLQLARLDPGIPLGPLQLRASYQGSLAAPLAGKLILYQLDAGLLGGRLQLRPDTFALARPPLRARLEVSGLDLGELLDIYPAEGLAGSGQLDGELPLIWADGALRIDAGQLRARPPGGVLQLRNPAIRRFARDNPALATATRALEDFRYEHLDGRLDYAAQGRLRLALRLHGSNPQLEAGRAVHFTINLEENVPSLLTSLQVSGRVNEAIQRRVQQRLPAPP